MFAMNATLKPRSMAAYTGSSSNTSRERVLRVSSIGRLSDDPSSRPCEGRCKTSIDCFTSEAQERERRGLGAHGSMDGRQVFEQAFSPDPFGPTTQIARSPKMPVKPTAAVETRSPAGSWQDSATDRPRTVP